MRDSLLVQVEPAGEAAALVRAPRVGFWHAPPREGSLVGPGSFLGRLQQLERRFDLYLPEGTAGRVIEAPAGAMVALQYGEVMFRIVALLDGVTSRSSSEAAWSEGGGSGMLTLLSPTDGVFYRRPRPDAEPFLEPGDRVQSGQPVGLVEVMKTFNQILYGGHGFPESAEVVEFRCKEGEEVSAGQVLLLLR